MNQKVYNQLNRACINAKKQGLNLKPGHFGIVVRGGVWQARSKNICLISAFLLGKEYEADNRNSLFGRAKADASLKLELSEEQVTDIICGFDGLNGWADRRELEDVGKALREKYYAK